MRARLIPIGLAFAIMPLLSFPAYSGCDSRVAQCVYIGEDGDEKYDGLCAATACGNTSSVFAFLRFPNSTGVRIDFMRDSAELDPPELVGMSSSGKSGKSVQLDLFSGHPEGSWIAKTKAGEIYSVIDCMDSCKPIDPDTFENLQKYL